MNGKTPNTKVKVMIVEDSILQRAMIRSMLEKDKEKRFEVVASAHNGVDALEKLKRHKDEIDVITLDVEMPKMNGLETLSNIMKMAPKPVVMFSSLTKKGAQETIQALSCGAVDFLTKPANGEVKNLGGELLEKVLHASQTKLAHAERTRLPVIAPTDVAKKIKSTKLLSHLVLIGTSTGGPRSLTRILSELPEGFAAGIVIAQHMQTGGFTASLANSLNKVSPYEVKEAEDGDELTDGKVFVAPAGLQTEIHIKNGKFILFTSDKKTASRHKPSVDELFLSASYIKTNIPMFGVVLTGMGDDGCKGSEALRKKQVPIIAESERTAVLYGMPKQVAARGLADYIEDLENVFPRIQQIIKSTSS